MCVCVSPYPQLGFGETQMLDKLLYEEEVKRCIMTFEQQFHYGVFYSYMKLREQEIRNIMWISECVAQVSQRTGNRISTCTQREGGRKQAYAIRVMGNQCKQRFSVDRLSMVAKRAGLGMKGVIGYRGSCRIAGCVRYAHACVCVCLCVRVACDLLAGPKGAH